MKKLNKDSNVLKNSVEAYMCSSCSFCSCTCTCSGGAVSSPYSGQLASPASYSSTNIRA